jgi:hypothetical protein
MRLKYFYTLLSAILLWTIYNSNSSGAGSANFNCNNCHNGSTSATQIDSVILRDVTTLDKMVKYSPTKPYIITIFGSNSGTLNRFGFQMNHGGKGSFSAPSSDCQVSGNIWEHNKKILGNSGKFQVSARWNAPAKGSGSVTLEAFLNAVDNDNGTSGDKPSSKFTYTFDELTSADSASVEIQVIAGSHETKLPELVTFKAFPYNGGPTPEYQWKVNSKNIGTKGFEDTYSTSTLKNNDTVSCWMYSSNPGALPNPAVSNKIIRVIFSSNPNTGSIQTNKDSKVPHLFEISENRFRLSHSTQIDKISLFSLSGTLVFRHSFNESEILDLGTLPRGTYIAKILNNNTMYTQKFILK